MNAASRSRMKTTERAMPDRRRITLAETFADSRVMATRQRRKVLRRPMYVVYLFVQPVIFVLLFRYVFGGAINTGRVSYVNYLLPGIIVMTAVFSALTTGLGLTEDLATGVVDRFRSLPIARSAVLLGRTAADLATNCLTLLVMLVIGLAVGFRPSQPLYQDALAFLLVLGFGYVFSWISAFVGTSVRDPETAQSVGFIWVFPLVFASSAFVPTNHDARHRARLRRCQPGQPDRQRRARPDHRPRRRPSPDTRHPRLARGPDARIRSPLGSCLPARVSRRAPSGNDRH